MHADAMKAGCFEVVAQTGVETCGKYIGYCMFEGTPIRSQGAELPTLPLRTPGQVQ